MPISRLVDKKTEVQLPQYAMEYYTAERKKELLHFVSPWSELENIVLSEISQLVKDKYYMISQEEANEQNRTTGMETWNRLKVTRE